MLLPHPQVSRYLLPSNLRYSDFRQASFNWRKSKPCLQYSAVDDLELCLQSHLRADLHAPFRLEILNPWHCHPCTSLIEMSFTMPLTTNKHSATYSPQLHLSGVIKLPKRITNLATDGSTRMSSWRDVVLLGRATVDWEH